MDFTKINKWLLFGGVLIAFASGVFLTRWYFQKSEIVEEENSTVLLEQVKAVSKLITVEGYFSEIYDYQDYYGYDLSIFRKKALIRVKAKVHVGYDLEKMKITAQPNRKTIVMTGLPPAELIALEHDLDYYDIQEGIFNTFTTSDYNKLNAKAKDFIRQKAQESELFDAAQRQRNQLFEMIRFMVESAGWQLEVEGFELPELSDSLLNG